MKMRRERVRGALLLLLGSLMLSGCGMQEAPYELTEEEQQLIVSYSSHVVSKFNKFQKDGLTYIPESALDEEEEPTEAVTVPETEKTEEDTENVSTEVIGEVQDTEIEEPAKETTFETIFADMGLTFTYLGNEVTTSYMADSTYAVNAGIGKKLLVLKLKVENLTEEAIVIDNLTSGDIYSAKYTMASEKRYHAKSVMTLLLNDFTTYEGTLEPQAAEEMVIVFEIPAETEAVDTVELKIERNGNIFQINL
ncbi:MAG: hypothetical protein IKU69_05230 [Roseburia sp.]|nr:hypothetical protein [Roseburia sp.]